MLSTPQIGQNVARLDKNEEWAASLGVPLGLPPAIVEHGEEDIVEYHETAARRDGTD